MKKDVIKRQTNTINKLEDALIFLLETNDLSSIKTRELCKIAKVNHQTFYNYYYDHFDLYEDIENKAIEEGFLIIDSAFNNPNSKNEYIEKIKGTKYFISLLKQKNNSLFKQKINDVIFPILEAKIRIMSREKEKKYLSLYIFNGSLSIIEEWIKSNYVDDPEYIASLIYKIAASIDLYH